MPMPKHRKQAFAILAGGLLLAATPRPAAAQMGAGPNDMQKLSLEALTAPPRPAPRPEPRYRDADVAPRHGHAAHGLHGRTDGHGHAAGLRQVSATHHAGGAAGGHHSGGHRR